MPFLQEKWESLGGKTRMALQITAGILFALLSAYFLFKPREDDGSLMDINLVAAIVVALAGPNIAETQTGNKLPALRFAMLITLGASIAFFALNAWQGWFALG